ncbi:hypothetical protein SAMN02982918_0217 [Saccharomonospora viridis]|nr:hypothetical protein SAMN02982918_0217 [Saccharomonospora viridis]
MKVPRLRRSGVSKKWTQAEPMRWVGTRLPEKVPAKAREVLSGVKRSSPRTPALLSEKSECLYSSDWVG